MDQINLQYTTIKDPLPDFIYEGLSSYSKTSNSYHPQPGELVEKLAAKHGVPKEMIYLTAGADEAIQMFAKAYGKNAYVFTPTYIVYADVEEFGGKLTRLYSITDSGYSVSTDSIPEASLIFLANPNNPAGMTSRENVLQLVKNNPLATVVIDEAYGEFADLSVIDQVKNHPRLAVIRSFSKAYGMAGNRIGYIIANTETINVVKNKSQWANVSYLSVGAASVAMNNEDYFVQIRQNLNTRRDKFVEFLTKSGFLTLDSKINAVVIKFKSEADGTAFADYLTKNNFIINQGNGNSNMGLDKTFIRIAIGTDIQMETLKQAIATYVL